MQTLEKLLKDQQTNLLVQGEWSVIRWIPDLATGETLNIGVVFLENNRIHARVLEYYERINCFYGEKAVFQLELVAKIVKESLSQNNFESPIAQVYYQNKGFAQGVTIDEILSTLFDQTVSLDKKVLKQKTDKFTSTTTDKLYTCLVDELKKIAGLDFEKFTPVNKYISFHDNVSNHNLYVPFRDEKKLLGGLASAVYSDPQKIELNILKAARDVETAIKLGWGTKPCVFLLKPDNKDQILKPEQLSAIDGALDVFDWHMKNQGVDVQSHVEIPGLAEEIYRWAKAA